MMASQQNHYIEMPANLLALHKKRAAQTSGSWI
jgi:hypothetical protein